MHSKKGLAFIGCVVGVILLGVLLIIPSKDRIQDQEQESFQSDQLKRKSQKEPLIPASIKQEKQATIVKKNLLDKVSSVETRRQSMVSSSFKEKNSTDHLPDELSSGNKIDEQHPMYNIMKRGFSGFKKPKGLIELMDKNKDGYIAFDEFKGPAETFNMLDADDDGIISADDLDNPRPPDAVAKYDEQSTGETAPSYSEESTGQSQSIMNWDSRKAFEAMDADTDGYISRDEFKGSRAIFGKLDMNNDSEISLDELEALPQILQPKKEENTE